MWGTPAATHQHTFLKKSSTSLTTSHNLNAREKEGVAARYSRRAPTCMLGGDARSFPTESPRQEGQEAGEAPAKLQAATYPGTQMEGGIAKHGQSFIAGLASSHLIFGIFLEIHQQCFDTNQTQKHAVIQYRIHSSTPGLRFQVTR